MGVGNGQIFEDTLDGAVLAERTMQRIEDSIRLERGEHSTNIAPDIDAGNLVAFILKRIRTRLPRRQRHGPLRRESAQEDSHMLVLHFPSSLSRRARNHSFSGQIESESPGRLPPRRKTRSTRRTTQIRKRFRAENQRVDSL